MRIFYQWFYNINKKRLVKNFVLFLFYILIIFIIYIILKDNSVTNITFQEPKLFDTL